MKITRVKLSVAIDAEMKGTTIGEADFDLLFKDNVVYAKSKKDKYSSKVFMIFPTNIAYMTLELSETEEKKSLAELIAPKKKD
jgi:hypothetical protein